MCDFFGGTERGVGHVDGRKRVGKMQFHVVLCL